MYDAVLFTGLKDFHPTSMPTIGAFKIAHMLRQQGYKVLVVNNLHTFSEQEFEELIFLAVSKKTKFVGISTTFLWLYDDCMFPQGSWFEYVAVEKLKKINPDIKLVVGGTKAYSGYNNRWADYAIVGYGETSILNLMNHLDHSTALKNSHKNIHGVTIIDDKLAPGYEFTKDSMRWLPEDVVNYKSIPIEMARGCIFKCKFCAHMMTGKKKLDYIKEFDIMKEEMTQIYKDYGITHYVCLDDTFNDNVDKLYAINDVIQSLDFQPKFWAYNRLDLISSFPETLPLLDSIGIRASFFGIETLDPTAAKIIGKGSDRQKLLDMLTNMHENYPQISKHCSFIAGLPHESADSFKNTVYRILSGEIKVDSFSMQPLRLQKPNTYQADSTFDSIAKDYGYEELSFNDPKHNRQFNNVSINWKSPWWNYRDAYDFIEKMYEVAFRSEHASYMEGLWAMGMHSYEDQNPFFTFDNVRKTKMPDFNFDLLHRVRDVFDQEYKRKLFKIIDHGA